MIGVVVPCLNGAATLGRTLDTVAGLPVVVCDGGSVDDGLRLAEERGARVLRTPRGRGVQLAAGADAMATPWLLFLHADTRLSPGWRDVAHGFAADPANAARAGYFRLRFDSDAPAARRVERAVAWRSRALGLPYGDQGLLIAAAFYRAIGGFAPLPLMEDVDLARRIGRRRLVPLEADAVTSAARYERDGWVLRPARNLLCLSLHMAGVPPRLIRRIYG
ncbi:glycosyltransferase [Azospirillum sp. RWY-5-1]|uniref:Glycosyltransferase n=1 Tax=Azospirillum oleiclasticum TaxID=2735135 RepID=A0ABX2T3I0_9PROT|nr:TIGR04283 family arsenosugar biosynthesis glycosyltransferase [Azospirillum oleiclasticum]NYZ11711.1 glycosyltransferase [Azospirillum oleiclasticum]NYZ18872.1 glycosyltransferase [Azospirillum oleiclasticum]